MNKDDRRVRKTKKAITEALINLLQNKELHNITIKELTDAADIHRATFYVHYEDIYDLYKQLEDGVIAELSMLIANDSTHSYEHIYTAIVDYVYANINLYSMFYGPFANQSFQHRVISTLEECYLNIWLYEDNLTEITAEMRFLASYNVQGSIAIVIQWLKNECSYPKESVIALLKMVNDNFDNLI